MVYDVSKYEILSYNMLLNLQGILVALVILYAMLFANFWFTVVLAYPYDVKSHNSDNLHSSNSIVGSSNHDNNLLTLYNITNNVSFTGEVNVSNLPNLPSSKPGEIIDPEEHYLTRNYTSYINAKKQAELLRPANTSTSRVIEIQHPDLPSLVPNSGNNNSSAIIKTRFQGLSQVCCIPPDIQLAVGSKYVMETVNSEAAIYTKTGSLIKKFGLEFLFSLPSRESSDSHSITDPVLLFDSTTNYTASNSHINGINNIDNRRWFASISDVTTHSIRIAVSKTNDPTGVWRTYNFPFENLPNNCSDQPFIAVSDDKLVIGVNTWSNNCDWSNNNDNLTSSPKFRGVQFVVADKHDLLAEDEIAHIKSMQSVPNTKYFSLRPALILSPTTALFLVTTDDFNHDMVQIVTIDGKLSNLHINKPISGNIHITSISPDGIQPIISSTISGNNNNNDKRGQQQNIRQETLATVKEKHPEYFVHTGDARMQSPIWHKGKLLFALNVGCFINGDTQSRSCIRIIEFDTNTSKVLLDVNIGNLGASLYYPALSIDKSGVNMGIIFGYSSSNTYPSLLISSSSVKNNLIFNSKYFQFLKDGTANSLSTRYGDYFSAVMDPSEPNTIWVAGQYYYYYYYYSSSSPLLWSTYIGKINTESSRSSQ
jgi:hypothetical protein